MIRPAAEADTPILLEMTEKTGYFKPMEIETLEGILDEYHEADLSDGSRCFVVEEEGKLLGFVYHAPEPMTDGSWTLWWIVVRQDAQGRGLGGRLLEFVECDARQEGGRILFVETSGLPLYEPTRRFYLKHGYQEEARVRDFYAEGDDQLFYRKRLTSPAQSSPA